LNAFNASAAGMIVKRYTAVAVVIGLGLGLASCGQFTASVADHWPRWAGGMPDDVPPRPGAPGYSEFISHGGADQGAVKSSAAGPGVTAAPEFVATGSAPTGKKTAAAAAKPTIQPASAPQVAPPEDQPSEDTSVVKGGLY
jgi:hypothetical protein